MEIKTNMRNYLGENCRRFFKVPAYQRGYKWSVPQKNIGSSVEVLLDDIINAMKAKKDEYFIQGITACEEGHDIVLIDGQQRTTTLFLLLHLLLSDKEKKQLLFFNDKFKLKYEVRESSHKYLESLCRGTLSQDEKKNTQDICYFDLALKQIEKKTHNIDRNGLKQYVLSHVMIFLIAIPLEQASRVFSMLNGAKAFMKTDELIKADFLCKVSSMSERELKTSNLDKTLTILTQQIGETWETDALRSMFARQWDKWLYWWNRSDVREFFRSGRNPLGLLLEYFFESDGRREKMYSNQKEDVPAIFKAFQNLFIREQVDAKNNFERLRKLQKKFEDLFSQPHHYNHLGMALIMADRRKFKDIIRYFVDHTKEPAKLRQCALLALVDVPPEKVENSEIVKEKIRDMLRLIAGKEVYTDDDRKEHAFRQLFRLNVDAANERMMKFEFMTCDDNGRFSNFYDERSLEHVWPKSRIDNPEAGQSLSRADFPPDLSEHCIGNLLFLHKIDNSKFHDKVPEGKKKLYFDLNQKLFSRNLLHTMSVFAFENWDMEHAIGNIRENQKSVLQKIEKGYEKYE